MQRRTTAILIVATVLVAVALLWIMPGVRSRLKFAVGMAGLLAPAPPEPLLTWDIAAGQPVPLPVAHRSPSGEQFHYLTKRADHRDVDIVLPGGRRARYQGVSGIVCSTASSDVRSITLRFPLSDWDSARTRANALMREWGIDGLAELAQWEAEGLGLREHGNSGRRTWVSPQSAGSPFAIVEVEGDSDARRRAHWEVELRIVFDPPAQTPSTDL